MGYGFCLWEAAQEPALHGCLLHRNWRCEILTWQFGQAIDDWPCLLTLPPRPRVDGLVVIDEAQSIRK